MQKKLVIPLALFVSGAFCLLAAKVTEDYNHDFDFGRLHTYSWIKVQTHDPLWEPRIRTDVDNALQAKGWQMVPSGGDAAVAAYGSAHEQRTFQTWYDGFGGGWYWRGWGPRMATTTVQNTPVGTLTVDIFDAQSKNLIWRGMASETLSDKPEKNESKVQHEVNDMFKHFPPAPKG